MGIFNFNHDKDATKTLGFDSDIFPNCASYEVTANSDTSAGAFMSFNKNLFKGVVFNIGLLIENGIMDTNDRADCRYTDYIPVKPDTDYIFTLGTGRQRSACYDINKNFLLYSNGTRFHTTSDTAYVVVSSQASWTAADIVTHKDGVLYEGSEMVEPTKEDELAYLKESFELRHPDEDDVAEDWGFMGVETEIPQYSVDYTYSSNYKNTTYISTDFFDNDTLTVKTINDTDWQITYADVNGAWKANSSAAKSGESLTIDKNYPLMSIVDRMGISIPPKLSININGFDYTYGNDLNGSNEIKNPYPNGETIKGWSDKHGLKALIDWVDNCTDEEFVRDFEEHFHKDYTLRYFCLVTLIGAVDNLGGQYSCRV